MSASNLSTHEIIELHGGGYPASLGVPNAGTSPKKETLGRPLVPRTPPKETLRPLTSAAPQRVVASLPASKNDAINHLEQTTMSKPMTKEQQQPIVEQLRAHADTVWRMDKFDEEGKGNFLRITPAGQVFLDVIKPGIHFSRVVQLAGNISPEGITIIRDKFLNQGNLFWEMSFPQGFLPEGITEHTIDSTFDENGGSRPGAVFVFDRILDLGMASDTQRAVLHWIGRHTNPSRSGEAFQIEDSLAFEWESLPTH